MGTRYSDTLRAMNFKKCTEDKNQVMVSDEQALTTVKLVPFHQVSIPKQQLLASIRLRVFFLIPQLVGGSGTLTHFIGNINGKMYTKFIKHANKQKMTFEGYNKLIING